MSSQEDGEIDEQDDGQDCLGVGRGSPRGRGHSLDCYDANKPGYAADNDLNLDDPLRYISHFREITTISVPPHEWASVESHSRSGKRQDKVQLGRNWYEILKSAIRTEFGCALAFSYNHCSSGKQKDKPFNRTDATCTFPNCRKYRFIIKIPPEVGKIVEIVVLSDKDRIQHDNEIRTTGLRGDKRKEVSTEVKEKGASSIYESLASSIPENELAMGNTTSMPTLGTLRQAASELRKEEQFSRHTLVDLYEYAKFLAEDCNGGNSENYIRRIINTPHGELSLHLYSKIMLQSYIRLAKTKSLLSHLDATGSLIIRPRELNRQTGFYYYALVAASENHAEPLAELVSNDHRWVAIAYWLKELIACVSCQSEANVPQKVEIDFSWAFLIACNDAFNRCEVREYINRAYSLAHKGLEMPNDRTVIHLCCSHMIHAVSRRLFKANPPLSKTLRQAALRAFAVFQNCTRLDEANIAFAHIFRLFNLRYHSDATLAAWKYIVGLAEEQSPIEPAWPKEDTPELHKPYRGISPAGDGAEGENWKQKKDSLKSASSFTKHFTEQLQPLLGESDQGTVQNQYYSTAAFKVITKDLYLFPLWSRLLLNKFQGITRDSNACVEDWMRHLKRDILHNKRLSIKEFIRETMHWTEARIGTIKNEQCLIVRKKLSKDNLELIPEKWNKRTGTCLPSHYAKLFPLDEPAMTDSACTKSKARSNPPSRTLKPIPTRIDVWNLSLLDDTDDQTRGEDFSQARGALAARTKAYDVDPDVRQNLPAFRDNRIHSVNETQLESDSLVENWICELNLRVAELNILESRSYLNSEIILAVMKVLRLQFPDIHGFLPPSYVEDLHYAIRSGRFIQILHTNQPQHWVVIQSVSDVKDQVLLFDSLFDRPGSSIPEQVASLLRTPLDRFSIRTSWCPKQGNGYACGDHAIANTVQLLMDPSAYNTHDWSWNERLLRTHIKESLEKRTYTEFPKVKIPNSAVRILDEMQYAVFCICRQTGVENSPYLPTSGINWVQCDGDNCGRWFHMHCVGLLDSEIEKVRQRKWICPLCKFRTNEKA